MSRFLIEVPHEVEIVACAKVVKTFLSTGSHFLTHADWGCMDGNHSAWMIVESASKDEARLIVPPPFRADARVISLNSFTMEQMDAVIKLHQS